MAIVKDTVLYIGEDIYRALSEQEQETFESVERYKPDDLGEQMRFWDEQGKDWKDEIGPFTDLDDYEEFWGDDWSNTGGHVYKRVSDYITDEDEERFKKIAEEKEGNQIRILLE
mgnify:FL=1